VFQVAATVAAPVAEPFFTNDLPGFLKIVAVYGSTVGIILAARVKLAFNAHTKRVDQQETQLNGLGGRLTEAETAQTTCTTRVGEIARAVAVQHAELAAVQRELGEHGSAIASFQRVQNEQQRDIMDAITASGKAIAKEITDVRIEMARLDERGKFGEAISELAHAMRDRQDGSH
jgi:hypothetical protein